MGIRSDLMEKSLKRLFRKLICTTVAFASVWTAAQVKPPTPIVASRGVAVVDTEAGKVQGFIHQGIFTYRGILTRRPVVLCRLRSP